MRLAILLVVLALQGCAKTLPVMVHTPSITVSVDPNQLSKKEKARSSLKYSDQKIVECRVILREYPICLLHELRHCFEGHWHSPGIDNTEDCY